MKRTVPLFVALTLLISGCGVNQENRNSEEKQPAKKEVQKQNNINFKNYIKTKGSVIYLVSNRDGDSSNRLNGESRVDAMMVSEGRGKAKVFNTGYGYSKSLRLEQFDDVEKKVIYEVARKGDRGFIEDQIKQAQRAMEEKEAKVSTPSASATPELREEYESIQQLKYTEPAEKEINYGSKKINGEKALYLNIVPQQITHKKSEGLHKDSDGVYAIEANAETLIYFNEPTSVIKVGNKNYIGFKVINNADNGFGMIVVEAPKGTKGITSGLDQ